MFQTTRNRLPNIVLVIYCAIYLFVLMDLLLIDRRPSLDYLSVSLPNWILAPPGVAMLIWLRLFSQKSRCSNGPMIAINNPLCLSHPATAQMALSQKKRFFLACLLLLGLQFLMTYCIWFYVGFDVGIVRISAQYAAAGDVYPLANAYFGTNPNNLGIYFLTILFLRLGDFLHMDGYLLLIFFGAWLSNLAVMLTGLCARRLTGRNRAMWGGFLWGGLLFGLSPWITVPYTDTFSLLLPILTLYLYLMFRRRKMHPFVKVFLICIVPMLGYLVKPTNAIMLIAILCSEIVHYQSIKLTWKKAIFGALALILCMGCCAAAMAGIRRYTGIAPDEVSEKTMMHYAMMGANVETVGNYNQEDDAYTSSFPGRKLKNQKDWERLRERLSEMGSTGYLEHVAKKTLRNFNNGTFGWGREKSDFAELIPQRDSPVATFFQDIYYMDGEDSPYRMGKGGTLYPTYVMLVQFLWITLLLFCLVPHECSRDNTLLMFALLGIFFMVTIFETNTRYLFSYVPLFVVMGVTGKGGAG